jgi:periplasmic protein TonB
VTMMGGNLTWRMGVGTSVLLHGAAICAMSLGFSFLPPPQKAADAAMTVDLAPVASAPPEPPRQTPQGPQKVEAVARPRRVDAPKIPPPPQLSVPVKAEVEVPIKTETQPDRPVMKQAADETTAPQAISAPPKPDNAAPSAGASSTASNAPQTWESSILARLARNKRYPSAAQSEHQQDVVYVKLVIDSAGRVTSANVVRSQGFPMLDREVISLAHRSSPFPAPPAAAGDPVVVVVPVEFYITKHRG